MPDTGNFEWKNTLTDSPLKAYCHLLSDVIKSSRTFSNLLHLSEEWCFIVWLNTAYYTTKVFVINTESSIYKNVLK